MFYYINRADAALQLIPYLAPYKSDRGVVLAVPRGGVPIAYHIAKKYGFPLELLMTKKIGHPSNPEFAIGAVSLEDAIIDERQAISREYLDQKISSIREDLRKKYKLFMGDHKPADLSGKTVIIVDDGIATGNTILSSIKMLKRKNPKRIVVAVPVAPPDTVAKIRKEVDDVICPYTPDEFFGVGYHYHDFSEVTDEDVIRILKDLGEYKNAA